MDPTGRPRYSDFQHRIGELFHAATPGGAHVGDWRLESAELLPKPPLDALGDADCFTLSFSCTESIAQKLYDLTAEDGFTVRMFAVPAARDSMCVTIN